MKTAIALLLAFACAGLQAHVLETNINLPLVESDTDAEYHTHQIQGWTVHIIASEVSDKPEQAEAMLWYMRGQLTDIVQRLPADKVKLLRTVEIWINNDADEDDDGCNVACYIPQNYGGSEFYEDRRETVILRNFDYILGAAWCCTDTLMIHELAHAYHDLFLEDGFYNDDIEDAYDEAKESGKYDENAVMYPWWDPLFVEHYGMTDASEFFATMTETFFLDYKTYPFNIAMLWSHDRDVYDLIYRAWYSSVTSDNTVYFSEPNSVEVPSNLMELPLNH